MNKKINQKKYLEALNFVFKLHSKQFRKGTKIPYFFHLSAVSNHVIENGGDTDEAIAGLLHDAVEDQGGEKTLKLIDDYIKNSLEGLYIEQEAYSHSKEIGTAFKLLTQLCQK